MRSEVKNIILASLMATLTGISALVRIPMVPVPFTLQTLFVLMAGNLLGPYWGVMSMGIYILMGLTGLPVFAGGDGFGILLSPTFGYIIGFPIAAYWCGKRMSRISMSKKDRIQFVRVWIIQVTALGWIYLFGVFYLWFIKNLYVGEKFPFYQAILAGFAIFLPGALIKSILATWLIIRLKNKHYMFTS